MPEADDQPATYDAARHTTMNSQQVDVRTDSLPRVIEHGQVDHAKKQPREYGHRQTRNDEQQKVTTETHEVRQL
jgi:hypothetical protein